MDVLDCTLTRVESICQMLNDLNIIRHMCRYTLTMNTSLRTDAPPDRAAIHRLLLSHIPSAKILRTSGAELVRTVASPDVVQLSLL